MMFLKVHKNVNFKELCTHLEYNTFCEVSNIGVIERYHAINGYLRIHIVMQVRRMSSTQNNSILLMIVEKYKLSK